MMSPEYTPDAADQPETPALDNVIFLPTQLVMREAAVEVIKNIDTTAHPSARYKLPGVVRVSQQPPQ